MEVPWYVRGGNVMEKIKIFGAFLGDLPFTRFHSTYIPDFARRSGSDGSMSASGSAGPGIDPRRGNKFSFENF